VTGLDRRDSRLALRSGTGVARHIRSPPRRFSLSGLLWISSNPESDRVSKSIAVVGIWASLIPLVLATLMFAEIEGDAKCDQAMVELEVAWLLLIMGTVYLFVSLEQLLTRVFANAVDHLARLISWTAIFLGAAGIYAGNTTMFTLLDGAGWETTLTSIAQLGLLASSKPGSWCSLASVLEVAGTVVGTRRTTRVRGCARCWGLRSVLLHCLREAADLDSTCCWMGPGAAVVCLRPRRRTAHSSISATTGIGRCDRRPLTWSRKHQLESPNKPPGPHCRT
jgi:hypothetical protein